MTNQRFFVDKELIDQARGQIVIVNSKQVNQICHVLRLKPGTKITILDGQGSVYECELKALSKDKVQATILHKSTGSSEAEPKLTVAMPLIRGGRFEWALEKLTELGVDTIAPISLKRSVVKMADDKQLAGKLTHWRAIVQEAAEQCERLMVPVIDQPKTLTDLLQTIGQFNLGIVACERAQAPLLSDVLKDRFACPKTSEAWPKHILIVVGPEGGFDDGEISQMSGALKVVSLGSRILRSETAAIYCAASVVAFGEISI